MAPLAVAAGEEYVLMTGVLSLLVGVVVIAVGQLPKLVGAEKAEGKVVQQLLGPFGEVGDWNTPHRPARCRALAILLVVHRVAPKALGALVVVVGSLLLVPAGWRCAR